MPKHKSTRAVKKGGRQSIGTRQLRPPQSTGSFQEHDAKRRLGSFEGAGEHARTGNRGRR